MLGVMVAAAYVFTGVIREEAKMYVIYNEKICRNCIFNNKQISEPTLIMDTEVRYINCQRDNEGAKEYFLRTLKNDNDLWCRQTVNFEHCLFAPENIKNKQSNEHLH